MLDDLKVASEDYISENIEVPDHKHEGSLSRVTFFIEVSNTQLETLYLGLQTRPCQDINGYAHLDPRRHHRRRPRYCFGRGYAQEPGSSNHQSPSSYPVGSGYPGAGYSIAGPSAGSPAVTDGLEYGSGYTGYPKMVLLITLDLQVMDLFRSQYIESKVNPLGEDRELYLVIYQN